MMTSCKSGVPHGGQSQRDAWPAETLWGIQASLITSTPGQKRGPGVAESPSLSPLSAERGCPVALGASQGAGGAAAAGYQVG